MKVARSSGAAAAVFCFLFCSSAAYPQDHQQNRPPVPTLPVFSHPSDDDKFLLDATNRERSAAGLQPLKWDEALATAARLHAQVMVSQNLLLHQCLDEPPLEQRAAKAGARFSMIAENIAVGPNPETIHNGWMHSPGHRKNILNADLRAVGIATMRGSGGLFAVQDFSRPVEALSLEQQEERVVSLLKGNGLLVTEVTADARETCNLGHGFAGAPGSYSIRFEVADLDRLPDNLLQKIKSRAYRKASVGACRAGDTPGFTHYHIAVLLN